MLLIAVCPPLCLSLLSFAVFCSGEGERVREEIKTVLYCQVSVIATVIMQCGYVLF
jgi:hypothetical protein